LQTELFLQLDHAGDGRILDCRQILAIERAGGVLLARAQQFRRPHQAADMFGSKGRRADHDERAASRRGPRGKRLCPLAPFCVPAAVIISCWELPSFTLSEMAT
jgi:hypothetical protein